MIYQYLDFTKPQKLRTTEEHNNIYVADCDIPGVYVPNMSHEDNCRWKCKHIKGKEERVEIRRWMGGANVVIIVFKDGSITISANSKMCLCENEYNEMVKIIDEAKFFLKSENET